MFFVLASFSGWRPCLSSMSEAALVFVSTELVRSTSSGNAGFVQGSDNVIDLWYLA